MSQVLSTPMGAPFANRNVTFLIVGLARSGTTLAQRLAAEIDGVWVPRETHFWSYYLGANDQFATPHLSRAAVRALVRRMKRPEDPLALTADEGAAVLDRVTSEGCSPWALFELIVDSLSPDGPRTLGEKTPGHAQIATRLLAEHPDLKVVAIVRDPRATFASMLGVTWGLRDCQRLAWRWRLLYERVLTDVDAFGRHRVSLVRYEDVVSDPASFQADLATFLGVPPALSSVDEALFLSRESWKQRALERPDPLRIDAWRRNLNAADVALIERITSPVAVRLGYVPTQPLAPHLAVDSDAAWTERRAAARFDIRS